MCRCVCLDVGERVCMCMCVRVCVCLCAQVCRACVPVQVMSTSLCFLVGYIPHLQTYLESILVLIILCDNLILSYFNYKHLQVGLALATTKTKPKKLKQNNNNKKKKKKTTPNETKHHHQQRNKQKSTNKRKT